MGWWSALGRHDAHGCHCSRAVVFLPLRSVPFSRLPPLLGSGIALDQWYPKRVKELPRKTRRSWDEPGHAHFLTWLCYRRLPLLTAERTRRWVVEAMDAVRQRLHVALWAYVIMPEHVHLLIRPRWADYEMRTILVGLKQPVALASRKYLVSKGDSVWLRRLSVEYPSRRVFRFWQPGGGFDRNIFREKSVPSIIEYIHNNPVRRELVDDPLDWEWSSARFWGGQTNVPLQMDMPDV